MRVALVHDYLNQYGGGERVLEALMEIFPEAPVYTLLYDEQKTRGHFAGRVKGTSLLDFQFARDNHRLFIPLMPLAARTMAIDDDYDLIISDSAGYAKGIPHNCHRHSHCPPHVSYIHTPLRYAWETDYLNFKFSTLPTGRQVFDFKFWKNFFKPVLNYLKSWDYQAGQKPDVLIANSRFIAEKIKKYYGREARVIYPPVDTARFYHDNNYDDDKEGSYYLAVGRLLHYKRFDLVIDTFAKLGLPLKIVGSGPDYNNLKFKIENLKLHHIELLPFASDEELRNLYNSAKALIFPQVEDFGLVAAEAQACGTPVIAYAAGGALEIVEEGKSGLFFREQTPEALVEAIKKFETISASGGKFNRRSIAAKAKRFSKENFRKAFLEEIKIMQTMLIHANTANKISSIRINS